MADEQKPFPNLITEDETSNLPLISDSSRPNNDNSNSAEYEGDEGNSNNLGPGGIHNGRPIPKQTAAGALLTGGFNTHKVYIGNLPETATLADLEDCFGQLGQCTCSIKRGFGFVDYTEPSSAAEAVAKYHEGHFLGAQIKVELSHARASIPKAPEDGKSSARNPPGSDRPSDARKPMHINGPPTQGNQGKPRFNNHNNNHHNNSNHNNHNNNNNFREPRGPPQSDYPRRNGGGDSDRYASRDGPPPFRNDAPYGNDRPPYRDDYRDSRGPPPPPSFQDSRYPPSRDFDRYGPPPPQRGPPLPLSGSPPLGYNNGPPPPSRDPRDNRPPYDPYYDAPRGGNGDYPPYSSGRPGGATSPGGGGYGLPLPLADRSPYGGPPPPPIGGPPFDRYGSGPSPSIPPPFDGPPPRIPYDNLSGGPGNDRYDPRSGPSSIPGSGREERNPRYNPYGRPSPPRDGPGGNNGYRSPPPYRGGPPNDRRRSMSPPPRSYQPFDGNSSVNRVPLGNGGGYGDRYNNGASNGGGGGGGGGGGQNEYNPR